MTTVIRVEQIGKRYRVGAEAGGLLRDKLAGALRDPVGLVRRRKRETFWALKDISFEVKEGEVLGLIGRNGAGKSTLLKVLARITKPTVGHAEIHGRVGSLLEVGTGFHPELSGRENVFLNGAILGMGRREITRKFDEIVAFAEVEKFIDTAVKHYSSGMYVRLAFAVAAHLETEILFVDEVLSVGDISFQKKCLGKMKDVSSAGRTVIFVSHNVSAVNTLCSRAVLLDLGGVVTEGPTADVVSAYHATSLGAVNSDGDLRNVTRTGTGAARFASIKLRPLAPTGAQAQVARPGCDLRIELDIEPRETISGVCVDLTINDPGGFRLLDVSTGKRAQYLDLRARERTRVEFLLRELLLKPGSYPIDIWMGRQWVDHQDWVLRAAILDVAPDVDSSNSPVIWPGPYACRFESSVTAVTVAVG